MTPINIAQLYFDWSNLSDFDRIQSLFKDNTTYKSGSGEMFIGVEDIMAMQRSYHLSFKSLNWHINSINEIKPGIILIDFDFKAESLQGNHDSYSGLETLIVSQEKIQHIDVSRK